MDGKNYTFKVLYDSMVVYCRCRYTRCGATLPLQRKRRERTQRRSSSQATPHNLDQRSNGANRAKTVRWRDSCKIVHCWQQAMQKISLRFILLVKRRVWQRIVAAKKRQFITRKKSGKVQLLCIEERIWQYRNLLKVSSPGAEYRVNLSFGMIGANKLWREHFSCSSYGKRIDQYE